MQNSQVLSVFRRLFVSGVFIFLKKEVFEVFSYEVKGGSYLRGGRSSNEIRRLTKHYYLTKWRPQIKLLRLFNDFLPLFHVHDWYWLVLQFFLLFVRDYRELILSCNSFVLRFTSLDVCEILRDAANSADAMNMLKGVKFLKSSLLRLTSDVP